MIYGYDLQGLGIVKASLGAAIRHVRKQLGMDQAEFARAMGVSRRATVSDWERGAEDVPFDRLEQIAGLAGTTTDKLFGVIQLDVRPDGTRQIRGAYVAKPDGSPADRIIYYVDQLADYRRLDLPLTVREKVGLAYDLAMKEAVPVGEFEKLDEWRDWLITEEETRRSGAVRDSDGADDLPVVPPEMYERLEPPVPPSKDRQPPD